MTNFHLKRVSVLALPEHHREYLGWYAFEAEWERPVDFARLDDRIDEIETWCVDQFGDSGERFVMIGLIYLFRYDADATVFRVRWC